MTDLRTLTQLADDTGLLPGDVVVRLNMEAHSWALTPTRHGPDVLYHVGGEVMPTGKRRGKVPFFGDMTRDADRALYLGLLAMRAAADAGHDRWLPEDEP